jgi:hypothetical protein
MPSVVIMLLLLAGFYDLFAGHGAQLYSSGKQGQVSSTTAASIGSSRRR